MKKLILILLIGFSCNAQFMNNFIYGKTKNTTPNTFIGGIGSVINTPALLAARLGIIENRIKGFKIVGSDVECRIVGGSYKIQDGAFTNAYFSSNSPTYYIDEDGLVNELGSSTFYNSFNTTYFWFPECVKVGNNQFYHQNQDPGSIPDIELIYLPKCTQLGETVNTDEAMFKNTLRTTNLTINRFLETCNSGLPDQDLIIGATLGVTITYVD